MTVSRRSFLRRTAAAAVGVPLILGLPELTLGADEAQARKWLKKALAEMKLHRAYGVALVIPDEPFTRDAKRMGLQTLLQTKDYKAREHLLEAVYVVVPARLVGAKKGETAVLLDPDGERVRGGDVVTAGEENFRETVDPLLRGSGLLQTRAKAAATDGVRRALTDLLGDDEKKRDAARGLLLRNFVRVAPAVIQARLDAKAPADVARLEGLVNAAFDARNGKKTGDTALPYGMTWNEDPSGQAFYCPPCGMGHVPKTSRGFLRFLTKRK